MAGCVSYLSERSRAPHANAGFYEIEAELPKYSKSITLTSKKVAIPTAGPILSSSVINNSVSDFLDLSISSKGAYSCLSDAKQNFRLVVRKYTGGNWENVGTNPITNDQAYWPNIEIINNNPVVFYVDRRNGYAVSGKYFDGVWQAIKTDELPASKVGVLKTHSYKNNVFLAYSDLTSGGVVSAIWNNDTWQLLPPLAKYNHHVLDLDLINVNNEVYIALIDSSVAYNIVVYKLNNNKWDAVGRFSIVDYFVGDLSLSTDGTKPYISYITYKDTSSSYKVNIKSLVGSSWKTIGKPFSTPGKARFSELQIYNGNIFLAYADLVNKQPVVLRLVNNEWKIISEADESLGKMSQLNHVVYNNYSYIGYIDEANNYRAVALPLPAKKLL